jgi:hypothetical protein
MLAMPAANLVVASRKEMTDTYEQFSCRAAERIDTPLWETADGPSIDDELLAMQTGPLSKFRYLFVNLLLPAYDGVRHGYARLQGEREGVLIGLALELYRREHGNWPATLVELSPRWLPELPVDRITGEPLKYKIIDNRPVVYSVGVDRIDDGGKLPVGCEGDSANYPVSAPHEWKNVDATQHMKDQYYGDWVIWSIADE